MNLYSDVFNFIKKKKMRVQPLKKSMKGGLNLFLNKTNFIELNEMKINKKINFTSECPTPCTKQIYIEHFS